MLLKALWWEGQVTPTQDSSPQNCLCPPTPGHWATCSGLWELKGILGSSSLFSSTLVAFTQGLHVLAQWTS